MYFSFEETFPVAGSAFTVFFTSHFLVTHSFGLCNLAYLVIPQVLIEFFQLLYGRLLEMSAYFQSHLRTVLSKVPQTFESYFPKCEMEIIFCE